MPRRWCNRCLFAEKQKNNNEAPSTEALLTAQKMDEKNRILCHRAYVGISHSRLACSRRRNWKLTDR